MPEMVKKAKRGEICTPVRGYSYYLIKVSRFCAWALVLLILLYVLSGFGMTRSGLIYKATGGLMDRGAALKIHTLLVIPMILAFLLHTLISIRFTMIRWNVKNKVVLNYGFIGLGAVLLGLTLYTYLI